MPGADKIFNGNMDDYNSIGSTIPCEAIVKFDSLQQIYSYKLTNYGVSNFEMKYSTDGTTWKPLGSVVTGNNQATYIQNIANPPEAMYYKFVVTGAMSGGGFIKELELNGYKTVVYPAGVTYANQKPIAYLAQPQKTVKINKAEGTFTIADLFKDFSTIRGTKYTSLKEVEWIDETLNFDELGNTTGIFAKAEKISTPVGVSYSTIDTSADATYRVTGVDFSVADIHGKEIGTTTLTIGNGGSVQNPNPPSMGGSSGGSVSTPDKDEAFDSTTGVEVKIDEKVTNVADPKLEVKKLDRNSEVVKKFITAAKGYNLVAQYEVNLFDGTVKITNVEGGKIQVSIPFVNIQPNMTYVILRYNENGTVTELPATLKNGMIIFETDHFSTYAIASKATSITPPIVKPVQPSANPQTGDTNSVVPLTVATLIALSGVAIITFRKKFDVE